jgi:Gpi18-like mannosyltransferase
MPKKMAIWVTAINPTLPLKMPYNGLYSQNHGVYMAIQWLFLWLTLPPLPNRVIELPD